MRIGLCGYGNIPTGLGTDFRWLSKLLPFERRIVVPYPGGKLRPVLRGDEFICGSRSAHEAVSGLDAVVALERPLPDDLFSVARENGVRTIMMTNPEWTPPSCSWIKDCDLFWARTNQARGHLLRFVPPEKVVRLQMPLDLDEFPFRERTRVESVVYLDGWGGTHERKGWPVVMQMLKLKHNCVRVKSQRTLAMVGDSKRSPWVSESSVEKPADLYADADAVLVPGRYDGLGLTVLEAMASGCVVLATDGPPYNEFLEAAYGDRFGWRLPVASRGKVRIWDHDWPTSEVDPVGAVRLVDAWRQNGEGINAWAPSREGRAYVEREHGEAAWQKLWEAICGWSE